MGTKGKAKENRPVRISRLVPEVKTMVLQGTVPALDSIMNPTSVVGRRLEFPGVAHL